MYGMHFLKKKLSYILSFIYNFNQLRDLLILCLQAFILQQITPPNFCRNFYKPHLFPIYIFLLFSQHFTFSEQQPVRRNIGIIPNN